MIYFLLISLLICLVIRYDINGKTEYKNTCYICLLVLLILLSGFRYRLGIDTTYYLYSYYHEIPMLHEITIDDLTFGKDPFFMLMNSIIKTVGGKFYIVQLVHAAIVNSLVFFYFRRYSECLFICALLYFVTVYLVLNMEEMRASLSVAISLYANDFIIKKKWLKGLILYGVCCLCHASSLFFLLFIPIISYIRFNTKGILILFALAAFGIIATQFLIENYQEIIDVNEVVEHKMEYYLTDEEHTVGKVNVFGYIGTIIGLIYPMVYLFFIKNHDKSSSLLVVEPFLMLFFLFSILSLQVPIIYRYVRFYSIYNILFVSSFIIHLLHKRSIFSKGIQSIRTLIIMLPFLYSIMKGYSDVKTYARYYPYSSIFDMETNDQREWVYRNFSGERVDLNEY